jgi:hypothetical protein
MSENARINGEPIYKSPDRPLKLQYVMHIILTQQGKCVAALEAFSANTREEQHVKYKHLCRVFLWSGFYNLVVSHP